MDVSPSRAAPRPSCRMVAACAGVLLAVAVIASVGASPAFAFSHVIIVDQRAGSHPLGDVAAEAQRTCESSEDVTLKVRTPSRTVSLYFSCSTIRNATLDGVAGLVANKLPVSDGTLEKVDRIIALRTMFFPEWGPQDRDLLIWSVATSGPSLRCTRDMHAANVRHDMASAARASGETPEHWTLVEAVDLAGFCPERLPEFYATVRRAGQPAAAKAVEHQLDPVL